MTLNRLPACSIALLFSFATLASAQSGAATNQPTSIHEQIQKIYNFHPHDLDKQQIAAKSAVMDKFWEAAKANREKYVPALRTEMADPANSQYFLYDVGKLLLSLSDTPEDRKIALATFSKSDFRDLQLLDYFLTVHHCATLGEDTTGAAFHILEEPKFQVFIVQHSLTLGQNYSLIYMLLPTDPSFWLDPAIARLKTEKQLGSKKSLLLLLWYAQTDAAESAILAFSSDPANDANARTFAKELIKSQENVGIEARAVAAFKGEDSLRRKRRELMKRVSDEALYELDSQTQQLIASRKKR